MNANVERNSATTRPRPILMIPLRRCGSHALRLRLNFSDQFHSPYPLHIVDFMPLVPLYGDLADDRAYFRMVVDVVGLQAASMVKWSGAVFDPVDIFEAIRDEPRSVHRIVWELLLRAGEQHGARVVMDKSLDSVHYADELMTLFPEMLFLNVVRDPRAQVASMNKAIIHDFDTTLNARTLAAAHRAARSLIAQHPERVLTIRYEDFLANQEQTLRQICAFFEIDYLPQMLDISRSAEAQQISQLSALWASNCFSPIAANIDKFKQQLTLDEIETIETTAQEYMQLYGYETMTDANALIDEAALTAARERSEIRKQAAWRELEQTNFRDYALRKFRADYLATVKQRLELAAPMPIAKGAVYKLDELKNAVFEVSD
ncbi:sulfotransferase family protein [Andreprevotia chitinilytica]|uniref:sulfotransferase family protein n=1 Tax=Andreprevotia chitinilytica TaxID=396808 RepID=UPI00068BA5DE|nr:sulfotransferase [Andreprevotia chitinilytica]